MKKQLNSENIARLLNKYKGNITAVARALNVTRQTVYTHIKNNPDLEIALDDSRESMLDNAESMLYKHISEGNVTALIFFLKTQGKSRGYVERQETKEIGWKEEIIKLLDDGRITRQQVEKELGNELATELFAAANLRAD